MIIDFHTHTFPEKIAAAALQKMQGDCHSAAFTKGTETALRDSMKEANIDYSVVLPVVTNPLKASHINRVSIEENGKNGLIFFGGIHPDTENFKSELEALAKNGIKGIKIHPVYQGVDIDDIRYLRIIEKAADLGLTVVTHAGDDIGFPGVYRCTPQMLLNVSKQINGAKIVAAHMGGWRRWQEVNELLVDTDIYIDTAFSLGNITPLEDGYYSPEELKLMKDLEFVKMIRAFGSQRVIFGTDSPWDSQKNMVERISSLPLSDDEKTNILSKNALRLLEIQ